LTKLKGDRFWYKGHLYEVLVNNLKVVGVDRWERRVKGSPKQIGNAFPARSSGIKGAKKSVKYKPEPMKEVVQK
jgi:hypothetical protein